MVLALLGGVTTWRRARPSVRREPGLSVLLITVDTLRADALGAYGKREASTPWMDRLAAAGVRYDDAHAHNVVTLPSHANIFSGRYPFDHGVRDNSGFRFPARMETLATLLKAKGYATGAFVSAFPLASRFGLARGFDVYEDRFVDAQDRPAFFEQERPGAETVALARRWLDAQAGRPAFCWVHIYEPHSPYAPPPPLAARFAADPYQGDVAAADEALAPLLEPLLARGDEGRTLVVLTGDHGESLGEHGESTHGIFAYEATLRVPLILYEPRLLSPRVAYTPARHVDLLPTILDALALPVPAGLPGRSLLTAEDATAARETTSYFEALSGRLNRGWAPLYGVLRDRQKYVELPIPELYDLRADPAEATNRVAGETSRLESLRAALAAFRAADHGPQRTAETAEARERLKSLGYVSGGASTAPASFTESDDPKRVIGLDGRLQEVATLQARGNLPAALARARELVALRPRMAISLLYLGELERQAGHLDAAIDDLKRALAETPDDPATLSVLGSCLTQAGRGGEAAALLAPAAGKADPDVDVLVAYALALAKQNRFPEALAALARARDLDPSNAMVAVNAGTVDLMAGDRDRAREAFESAVAANPRVARAHSSLAFLLAESGRAAESLEEWRKALALDAGESGKLLAVGILLDQRGRPAEARPYLELFVAAAPRPRYEREIARAQSWLAGGHAPSR